MLKKNIFNIYMLTFNINAKKLPKNLSSFFLTNTKTNYMKTNP
jgi:hypothetical protein